MLGNCDLMSAEAVRRHRGGLSIYCVGDWVQSTESWIDFEPGALVGQVTEVLPLHANGVYSIRVKTLGGQIVLVPAEYTVFLGEAVQVGDIFTEFINQGIRDCEVIAVKRTRYRIVFEMPHCEQQGWRSGIAAGGRLFTGSKFGTRLNHLEPFPGYTG